MCKPLLFLIFSISYLHSNAQKMYQFVTLDPGHFHAALVQKNMYPNLDSNVYVYSPGGMDLQMHLDRIKNYNTRKENPTHWKETIFEGDNFFEKMLQEKKGNIVVLSGNNKIKADYILKSLQNGFNVFADKPMAIDVAGFNKLKQSFEIAKKNKLLLYDIMTERFEINNILQREISKISEVFGTLQKGTTENPAIIKNSVHYFYKYVSGNVLVRPTWFLDGSQQGDGLVDVMTHLVDLVQWESFPDKIIDYKKDIVINSAKHWPTQMKLTEFNTITKTNGFPSFLKNNITNDTVLNIFCNGEINYTIKGVHAKTIASWDYKAPEGAGDNYYSLMKGSKCSLEIRQGKDEDFKPTLYFLPVNNNLPFEKILREKLKPILSKYVGAEIIKTNNGYKISMPDKWAEGHESHFARVTDNFLQYLSAGNLPNWEVPNMLTKYFITTMALQKAAK